VGPDVARGLALRVDHALNILPTIFPSKTVFGDNPRFRLRLRTQANGAVEGFFRTLVEQAIYCRIFNNLGEERAAIAAFVVTCNEDRHPEKLSF
jgi:hypothetical protein